MQEKKSIPELLAPAGSLEKLKLACEYGADAVYVGLPQYNLRQAAPNLTAQELQEAISWAHHHRKKVFLVLNNFFHDKDLARLGHEIARYREWGIDAFIVSDLGGLRLLKKEAPQIPLHLSTQASCLNSYSAKFWKRMGVSRLIAGRELSLSEARQIKRSSGLEIELFIHGSMCMAYSGHCTISNFTSGRDSNRGGCAHSCRHEYSLSTETKTVRGTFMSSKDLMGLEVLEAFVENHIDSLKIEGRMKGHNYVGTLCKVYREALDELALSGLNESRKQQLVSELKKVSHRGYTNGNLLTPAGGDSVYHQTEEQREDSILGTLVEVLPQKYALMWVKNRFDWQRPLEWVPFKGPNQSLLLENLVDFMGQELEQLNPSALIRIPYREGMQVNNILRREVKEC